MDQCSGVDLAAPAGTAEGRPVAAGDRLSRRHFLRGAAGLGLAGAGLSVLAGCTGAAPSAKPATTRARIGVLSIGTGPEMPEFEGLRRGLRELGYVEDQNVAFEYRFVQANAEALRQVAAELVALNVDVIVSHGLQACQAAKDATTTIPIVFGTGNDPVALGFAASLARPEGNMTGLVHSPPGLHAKRLQLLKQVVPGALRVGVLMRPANAAHAPNVSEAEAAAPALGVQVQPVEVHGADRIEAAFEATVGDRPDALLVLPDAVFFQVRGRIADLASKAQLPAVFQEREFAEVGGLLTYGVNLQENFRRAAAYIDKILKGARPADLPIEQPAKFDFVVNLRTAQALGLTIPPAVLERVTEVIV
jgi:putative ABC transport system substrate-binding protein